MAAEKFTVLTGVAAPLLRHNIDTDVIIRIERLVGLPPDQLGPYALEALRFRADGSEDPDFVLNRPAYRDSSILLAGDNFGCGSSREHAVWALWGRGIRAVIAPSFGDIFFSNCFQSGMLPVTLPIETIREIAEEVEASPGNARVTVDLASREIISPTGRRIPFQIDSTRRQQLLAGLDEIGTTLLREPEIAAFQSRDGKNRPWIYQLGAGGE